VVAVDISKPLEEQGGVVVEINTSPGLWLHLPPWTASAHPIGEAIVASMYPPGEEGRIPVVAIVGDSTGAAKKHLSALLRLTGLRAGSAGETEIVVGERRWAPQGRTTQERAGVLLQNTTVDVALLETSPRELVGAGFGNDRCNIALLLDTKVAEETPDADGQGEMGLDPGHFVQALRHALAPDGIFVLSAEGASARIEPKLTAARLFLVAGQGDCSRVSNHLAAGGRALMVQGDALVLAEGAEPVRLLGKRRWGMTERETEGLLAALAAGLVLGQHVETLKTYLCSLPDVESVIP